VNLYPFTFVAARLGVTDEEAVEMIDVGGPAMLRAAAKNFAHVAAVCRPEQYEPVLEELRARGTLSLELRRSLANEAFATTAAYDAAIARWFGETEAFPDQLTLSFSKVADLRISAARTTASWARAGTSSRTSSSSAGATSPTTTSPTSRRHAASLHGSPTRSRWS